MSTSKNSVSADFLNFAAVNEQQFEDAKTAEKQARGMPFPEGYSGTAVISDIRAATAANSGRPYVAVHAKCVDPDYQGKEFTAAIHSLFDSDKMTKDQRWAMMLDDLEELGLKRSTREEYGAGANIKHCFAELLDEPHYISFRVKKGYQDRLEAEAHSCPPPEGMTGAAPPTNENAALPSSPEVPEDATIVTFLGTEYVLLEKQDEGKVKIKAVASGKERVVSEDQITLKE